MVKNKIMNSKVKQPNLLKGCYGTSEWSQNSGICSNCKLQKACGKMRVENLHH